MPVLAPSSPDELAHVISEAIAGASKLEIRGGGSKAAVGAPRDVAIIDMRGLAGVVDYDPAELVLTVQAGTPLLEVEALLVGEGQMLAFEPVDFGDVMGGGPKLGTIGGMVASGLAGSRRLSRGSVRDHLLGFAAVSGRGERFVAGGKVVKNVTGYDLPKLLAGSWGRLAALTEVTLKVLPAPRHVATFVLRGLGPADACSVMAHALGSQAEVAAAAHLPNDGGITALRLEGFAQSVSARAEMLARTLPIELLPAEHANALWQQVRSLSPFRDSPRLWRLSIPARAMPELVGSLGGAKWIVDWSGALLWTDFAEEPAALRARVNEAGGHAMLMKAEPELRAKVPAMHPRPRFLAALEERVRCLFDPHSVFETGRFSDAAYAN